MKKDTSTTQIVELITAGRSGDIGLAAGHRQREHLREHDMSDHHSRDHRRRRDDAVPGAPSERAASPSTSSERSIGDAFAAGSAGSAPATRARCRRCSASSSSRSSSPRSADRFLSKYNIGNLPGQGAYIAVIALGLVFVLLLGEIDLSAGTAGGIVCRHRGAVAVFSGDLHTALPGLLYWCLIVVHGCWRIASRCGSRPGSAAVVVASAWCWSSPT